MEAAIYRDLDASVAYQCGYFQPKERVRLLDDEEFYGIQPRLTSRTQVIYFPGSFGTFHEGHVSVVKAAQAKYPKALIVISPANSDYTVQKYGAWSKRASNKERYDAIKRALPDAVIDIDPMLNHRCDQNFTDLLEQYLLAHGLVLNQMETTPIILAGKDRSDWLGLNKHHSYVKVEHFEDTTGASTSGLMNLQREKKRLFLRVHTVEEFMLFRHFFDDQYKDITCLYMQEEKACAQSMIDSYGYTHTICKDYADLLPYIPVHRTFVNPLEDASHPGLDPRFNSQMNVLDSDIFTGGTRDLIKRSGAGFGAVLNFEGQTDEFELLDIDDFRNPRFCYPYVDISSRCSMQAFDFDFHRHFKAFKAELNRVS